MNKKFSPHIKNKQKFLIFSTTFTTKRLTCLIEGYSNLNDFIQTPFCEYFIEQHYEGLKYPVVPSLNYRMEVDMNCRMAITS